MQAQNRESFLKGLRQALQDLPQEEIDNAVRYYEEYFDDAGEENMEQVLSQLGAPEKVAAQIRADLAVKQMETVPRTAKRGMSTLWMVLLAVLASPIALPLSIAVAAVVLSLGITAAALLITFVVCGVAVAAAGVAVAVISLFVVAQSPATTLLFFGLGMACAGLGLLLLAGGIRLSQGFFWLLVRLTDRLRRKKKPLVPQIPDLGASQSREIDRQEGGSI